MSAQRSQHARRGRTGAERSGSFSVHSRRLGGPLRCSRYIMQTLATTDDHDVLGTEGIENVSRTPREVDASCSGQTI